MSGRRRGGRSRRPRGGGGPGDVRQPLPHPAHTIDAHFNSVARLLGSSTQRYGNKCCGTARFTGSGSALMVTRSGSEDLTTF